MIKKSLTCHTNTVCTVIRTIHVEVELESRGALYLSYELTGDLAQICIPEPQSPTATDGLWEHTCFEVFIAAVGDERYFEFNFSPSGQWAAYAFSDYRMRSVWTVNQIPAIRFARNNAHLQLEAVIAAADLPVGKPLQLGLTAVIEADNGSLTYWALHHPEARPDFHHRAGFVLLLDQT